MVLYKPLSAIQTASVSSLKMFTNSIDAFYLASEGRSMALDTEFIDKCPALSV